MKVQIPDQLKEEMPHTTWGKILSATPVVMAVVATMLAGLASSEMTRAQYARALAAQQQSKAGDQWSFFQAKRLRGAFQTSTVDLLRSLVGVRSLDAAGLSAAIQSLPAGPGREGDVTAVKSEMTALVGSAAFRQAWDTVAKGEFPAAGVAPVLDPGIQAAQAGVESNLPEADIRTNLVKVSDKVLEQAVRAARDYAQAFDASTKPMNRAIDSMDTLLGRYAAMAPEKPAGAQQGPDLVRDFGAVRMRYTALRYELEARLNQAIANLYELQVRKSNMTAERHHARSQRFFFGMLAAQFGVIISTFAMAARKRSFLWSVAAGAGLLAIAFAIYVYLYV